MNERLTIESFGPIERAEIEPGDLTVFVGPQATGKSLAAQVLYFFRRYESLLVDLQGSPDVITRAALENWFGPDFGVYVSVGTRLRWSPRTAGEVQEVFWTDDGLRVSPSLARRITSPTQSEKAEVYIPAGRTLYSFLPPYSLLSRVLASQEWPGFILTFYETLGRTVSWLRRHQDDPMPEIDFLRERAEAIFKGRMRYSDETVMLQINGDLLSTANIAAGQMELWPFWVIVEAGVRSHRFDAAQIYFEEPEAHLHPAAQRGVMEMIAYLVGRGTRFLVTTHSPYLLYSINNLLLAHRVVEAGRALPDDIPAEAILRPSQVSAYRFRPDGRVESLMDREVGLIDESELDDVADDLGADFSALQDALEATG